MQNKEKAGKYMIPVPVAKWKPQGFPDIILAFGGNSAAAPAFSYFYISAPKIF